LPSFAPYRSAAKIARFKQKVKAVTIVSDNLGFRVFTEKRMLTQFLDGYTPNVKIILKALN